MTQHSPVNFFKDDKTPICNINWASFFKRNYDLMSFNLDTGERFEWKRREGKRRKGERCWPVRECRWTLLQHPYTWSCCCCWTPADWINGFVITPSLHRQYADLGECLFQYVPQFYWLCFNTLYVTVYNVFSLSLHNTFKFQSLLKQWFIRLDWKLIWRLIYNIFKKF